MQKSILTVTLFVSRAGLWRAEIIAGQACEPITDWLPNREQVETEAKHWFKRTLGPGLQINFEVVRDLRYQD